MRTINKIFVQLGFFDSQLARSLMPRPNPRGEEKGSGYNTTSRPTLEGRNQHTIVSDHVLTYAIYGILSMPCGLHCGAYYSNCAVIGHFTCQMAYVTGSSGMSYCPGGWGLGTRLASVSLKNELPGRTSGPCVFFFWTHFRLSLWMAKHLRMYSTTPSVYLDLEKGVLNMIE